MPQTSFKKKLKKQ